MELEHRFENNVCVVSLAGELTEKHSKEVYSRIMKLITTGKNNAVLVNMSKVPFITSGGLGMIMGLCKTLRAKRIKLGFCESSDTVFSILQMVRLDKRASMFRTETKGLKFLASFKG